MSFNPFDQYSVNFEVGAYTNVLSTVDNPTFVNGLDLSGNMSVSGVVTFDQMYASNVDVSGNLVVLGNLQVDGILSGNLGNILALSSNISGNSSVSGTLNVSGTSTLSNVLVSGNTST